MKTNLKYSLATLISGLIMASCSQDEIEQIPTTEGTRINLSSLADFETNMSKIKDDNKTYKAFVLQDIAVDSLGLAKTLADWEKLNNLETDWGNKGIFVEKHRTVYTMDDYKAAGSPKIKANPTNGLMPYAASVQDSLEYKKMGIELQVRRDGKVFTVETVSAFNEIIEQIEDEDKPVSIDIDGTINVSNSDSELLESVLDKIISNPNISTSGNIEISASTDSVAISNSFIEKLQSVNGKIVDNGSNALFIDKIENPELLRTVLDNGVKVRTNVSENFTNTDIAVPNKIVYRNSRAKTRNANEEIDFSAGIKSLPVRGANWKSQTYQLETEGSEINLRDETVLSRISQPSIRGTLEYPNPDIYTETDPVYSDIFLDNTRLYSDSTRLAIKQRIRGSKEKTKIRTKGLSSVDRYGIEHFYENKNVVEMQVNGTKFKTILLNINDNNLPLKHTIYAEHADLQVTTYNIDVQKYCFVLPESVELVPGNNLEIQFENDRKVMRLIEGNGIISITNRFVDNTGVGTLPERKSFFWITAEEYAKYVAQGKRAR